MAINEFDPDPRLLDRFLSGEATDDDRQALERWIRANPDARGDLAALYASLTAVHGTIPQYDHHARVASVVDYSVRSARRSRARIAPALGANSRTRLLQPRRVRQWLPALVGLLVLVGIGLTTRWRARRGVPELVATQYATGYGQRSAIVLPDGSRAILAPNTQLSYRPGRDGARTLSLVGQAQFTVTHQADRAFNVRVGGVQATVLGTTFDLRHYAEDTVVHVAVVTGKISVRGRGKPVLLVAGTESQITDSTALIATDRDLGANESWIQGRMVFNNVPVSVVLETLHRWYGYDFRLADTSLANRAVTTMLAVDDTTTTLTALRELLRVTMRFDGRTVTLYTVKRPQNAGDGTRSRRSSIFPAQAEVGK